MGCDDDPSVVRVRLANPPDELPEPGRNLIVASSCGMCGSRSIEDILEGLRPVGNTLTVPPSTLTAATEKMRARQNLFEQTGAAHAAGVFLPDGEIVAFAEDIGRHNALDKAIGKCLLMEQAIRGCGAVLSGRVSFELVTKAAGAGIELIVAISAPSSLAIDVARRTNITLCGFVRSGRATVYTNPQRIHGIEVGEA
ncbi:MAG: formate dehydrogenase accessory sulfurtransferase FdhD [Planctomycetes bacterium]|nr:formate dehydrogenase accessory sulfurtransferase FdhD [Planctomycetota bacterium]